MAEASALLRSADVSRIGDDVCNGGRCGDNDERGAPNLKSDATRAAARAIHPMAVF